MKIAPRLLFIRLAALVALAACSILVLDYVRATPAFCGVNSGCEKVMFSQISEKSIVPLPIVGLAAFAILYFVSLSPPQRLGRFLAPMAVLAGIIGLILILIQWYVIGAFCVLCMTVDVAAVAIAGIQVASKFFKGRQIPQPRFQYAGIPGTEGGESVAASPPAIVPGSLKSLPPFPGTSWTVPSTPVELEAPTAAAMAAERDESARWVWILLAFLAVGIALLAGFAKPRLRVPNEVKALWKPDKINVVEITDFDCPHCQNFHPVLLSVLAEYGERVNFVRIVMPLPRHEHARGAALAYHCAVDHGKGEEMADKLFEARGKLSPALYRKFAEELGLDVAKFDDCRHSRATDQKIDREAGWMARAGLRALPTTFVQDQVISGSASAESVKSAIRRAERAMKESKK